jgi:hypothetical protein
MEKPLPTPNELIDRPFRYFYEDGLVELAVGTLFLAAGLAIGAWGTSSPDSPWRLLGVAVLIGIPLAGSLIFRSLVQKVKDRWIHPRTGYVEYGDPQPSKARWVVIAGALVLAASGFFLPDRLNDMSLVEGALLGLVLATLGHRARLGRFYLLAAIAALIGLAAALLLNSDVSGSAVTFGATGGVMMLSGACALNRYLASHPPQPGPAAGT